MTRRFVRSMILLLLPLVCLSFYLPQLLSRMLIPSVELTFPTVRSYRDKIPLTGTVIAAESSELVCDLPYVISTVRTSVGDTVYAGEAVALIDQKKTISAWAEMLSLTQDAAAITALLPEGFTDLSALQDRIPSVLHAPASGTVIASTMVQNSLLSPGVSCLTVSDCETLLADLTADEQYATSIAVGDKIYLRSVSDDATVRTAVITDIAPAASEVLSGTTVQTVISLTAALEDPSELRPGYSIYGYHFPGEAIEQMLVPLSAVFQEGKEEFVYLYTDGLIQKRPITTDGILSQNAIVTGGLSPSDPVVVDVAGLTDGMPVRIRESKGAP